MSQLENELAALTKIQDRAIDRLTNALQIAVDALEDAEATMRNGGWLTNARYIVNRISTIRAMARSAKEREIQTP